MATTTLNGLQRSNTATVTYSVTRSSTSNAYVNVTMSISIYNGLRGNNWESPQGNGRFGANVGEWNDDVNVKNWTSYTKVGNDWGGISVLNYGATKTFGPYSASVYWPYSSAIPLGVYMDYHAGGWGPTANTQGLHWTINASVPTYTTTGKCSPPTKAYRSPSGTASVGVTQTITWEGASGGTNNSLVGYNFRYHGPNTSTWTYVYNLTNASYTITPNAAGRWSYGVQTRGSAGSSYYSDWGGWYFEAQTVGRCTAPTSVIIRSGSSTSSSSISSTDINTTFYVHWSAGGAGTNNPIDNYSCMYQNTTTGESTWSTMSATTSRYKSDSWSSAYTYRYTVRTNGEKESQFDSTYGTYTDTITIKPKNPTGMTIALTGTNGALKSINHPVYGSCYLLDWSNAPTSAVQLKLTPTGTTGAGYYRIYAGVFANGQTPGSSSTPSVMSWTRIGGNISRGSSYTYSLGRYFAGRVLQFRVDSMGYNGSGTTGYYYSLPIVLGGTIRFKVNGAWKIAVPKIKVNGTWKEPVMVWKKDNGVWKKTF